MIDGISPTRKCLLTLRVRKIRPLMMSPGLFCFAGETEKYSSSAVLIWGSEEVRSNSVENVQYQY